MTVKRKTQKVTVALERDLLNRAREAGINMSATLAAALEAELKKHATLRWREANKDTVANHN